MEQFGMASSVIINEIKEEKKKVVIGNYEMCDDNRNKSRRRNFPTQ